jgi:hypothetical protein
VLGTAAALEEVEIVVHGASDGVVPAPGQLVLGRGSRRWRGLQPAMPAGRADGAAYIPAHRLPT